MRICSTCGKVLEGGATRCPACGSASVTWTPDIPPAPTPKPAAPAAVAPAPEKPRTGGGITIIFNKGEDEAAIPVLNEPSPESSPAVVIVEPRKEVSVFSLLWERWRKKFVFWIGLSALLLTLVGIVWLVLKWDVIFPGQAASDPHAIDAVLTRQFSQMVDEMLPEKLEWGKDVLKRRVPSRFPEELLMEVDKQDPEIRFSNPEKTAAVFRFSIAYHYKETHKKLFSWVAVSFYFELRNGKWVIIGDRWVNEWEVSFE